MPASVVRSSRVIVPRSLSARRMARFGSTSFRSWRSSGYGSVVALQRVRLGGLEPDVQVQQLLAHLGPVVKVRVQGQAGKLPQQVDGVFVAVGGVVEHGVGVGENLLGGDAVLSGQGLELVAPLLPVVPVDVLDAPTV